MQVGKRYQNAISYVNAAFLFEFDQKSLTIHSRPRICFGGINPDFVSFKIKNSSCSSRSEFGLKFIIYSGACQSNRKIFGWKEANIGNSSTGYEISC